VREKRLVFSPDPACLSFYAGRDPFMMVSRHATTDHATTDHAVFVFDGRLVHHRWCRRRRRSSGDQPELYEAALAEHGVTLLSVTPIDFPNLVSDLRRTWADASEDHEW
jgi:hypothetical protein